MRHLPKVSALLVALLILPAGAAWARQRTGTPRAANRSFLRPTQPGKVANGPSISSLPSKQSKPAEGGTGVLSVDPMKKALLALRGKSSDAKSAGTTERHQRSHRNASLVSVFSPRNAFANTFFSNQSLAAVFFNQIIKNVSQKSASGRIWGQTFGTYAMTPTQLNGTRINRMNVAAASKNQTVYRGPNGEYLELGINGHYRIMGKGKKDNVVHEGDLSGAAVKEIRESWVGTPSLDKIDNMHKQIKLVLDDARAKANGKLKAGKHFLTYLHSPIPYLQRPVHNEHEDAKMVGQVLVRSNNKTGEVSAICPAGVEIRVKPDGTYRAYKSRVNFENPGDHPDPSLYTEGRKLMHSGKLSRRQLSFLRQLADDPSACPINDVPVAMGDGNC